VSTLVVLPLLVPLLAGALLLLAGRHSRTWPALVSAAAVLAQLLAALALAAATSDGTVLAYLAGNWAAPFGIALAADRLSALLLSLTAVLALASLLTGRDETDDTRTGGQFHGLLQLQLFGLNGAFLTADLFNLFVFFEVLLCASYALLVRGPGSERFTVATHYVVINLLASSLFLVAAALLYGVVGTLSMADLAVRVAAAPDADLPLINSAGLLLLTVFAVKAALLPLGLWLPATYRASPVAVSILFVLMTKVGVYATLRVSTVIFGLEVAPDGNLQIPALLPLAMATLAVSALGAIAARDLRSLVSNLVVGSAGTLLIVAAIGSPGVLAAGLFYLVHSTLGAALLFVVAGLLLSQRGADEDRIVAGSAGAARGSTGALFLLGAVGMAGLPPLAGFVAKARLLDALLAEVSSPGWMAGVMAVILGAALLTLLALVRAGTTLFWKPAQGPEAGSDRRPVRGKQLAALLLLSAWVAVSSVPAPMLVYATRVAGQLLEPEGYVEAVLGQAPVQRLSSAGEAP
jgi:multicomponent K+:H+ antiporter subunit D